MYQWEVERHQQAEEEKIGSSNDTTFIKEIEAEVDNKQIYQHKIKDIACTSNCLIFTTGILLN